MFDRSRLRCVWAPRLLAVVRRVCGGGLAVALDHFLIELADFFPDLPQLGSSAGGDLVDAADLAGDDVPLGSEISLLLHSVQRRVERSWPHAVAVAAELLDHPEAEERTFRGVVKH